MQAMMKRTILAALAVLTLAGCAGGGGYANNPWTQGTVAESAPSPLQPGENAVVTPAAPQPQPAFPAQPQGSDFQASITPFGTSPYQQAPQAAPGYPGGQPAYNPAYNNRPYATPVEQQPLPPVASAAPYGGAYGAAQVPAAALPQAAAAPVKVALLVPLSGKNEQLGQAMLQAAQLALFDMGNASFQLMPHDTGASPEAAQKAAREAIEEGSQLILGPLFSSDVRAIRYIAARAGVNVISFSTDWTVAGDNIFIMGFTPFEQVQRIAEFAALRGMRHIGVLAPQNDYGNVVTSAIRNSAPRFGLDIADVRRFPPSSENLADIVASFSHYYNDTPPAQPPYDAVLLPFAGRQVRSAAELMTLDGMPPQTVRRLGTGLWDDSDLMTEADLEGAWFAAPSPDLRRDFERRFTELYGHAPPRLSTLAYDATALASVLARNGSAAHGRPDFDHASIASPNGFAGVDGIFRFRPDGLVERGLAVLEMRAGAVRVIDPSPTTFQSFARTYGSQSAPQY
jgi:ABC-type branched-subunit amino acid transport system substrate-binding protein